MNSEEQSIRLQDNQQVLGKQILHRLDRIGAYFYKSFLNLSICCMAEVPGITPIFHIQK